MIRINQFTRIIRYYLQIKANSNFSKQISLNNIHREWKRFLFLLTSAGRILAYKGSHSIFVIFMLKQVSIYSLLLVMLASCSSLKTAFTGERENATNSHSNTVKKETKFLDQIDVPVESSQSKNEEAITPV